MIKGAPVGTVDFANLSGWINSELFLEWDYNNNYVGNLPIKIHLYFTFLLGMMGVFIEPQHPAQGTRPGARWSHFTPISKINNKKCW